MRAASIRHVSGRLLIASCTASFLAVVVVLMVTLEVAPGSPPGLALSSSAAKPSKVAEAAKDWTRAVDVDETRPLDEKQMQERVDHAKALLKEEVAAAKAKAHAAKAKAQASVSAKEQRLATAQEDTNDLTLKGAPPSFIAHEEAALQGDRLQVEVQGAYVCVDPSSLLCYES